MLRNLLVYGSGNAGAALLQIALVPIWLTVLSAEEFGVQAIAITSEQLLVVLTGYVFTTALGKFLVDAKSDDRADSREVVGSATVGVLALSAAGAALWLLLSPVLANLLLPGRIDALALTRLMGASFAGTLVAALCLNLWQLEGKAWLVAILGLARIALAFAIGFPLVAFGGAGVAGVLWGMVGASLLLGVFTLLYISRRWGLRARWPIVRGMGRYGLGLLPAAVANWAMRGADKLIVTQYAGLEATGIYSLALLLATGAAHVTVTPARQVWTPIMWQARSAVDEKAVHRSAFISFNAAHALLLFAVVWLSPLVMEVISHGQADFVSGWPLVGILYLTLVLFALVDFTGCGIFFGERTFLYSIALVTGGGAGLVLMWWLVPILGAYGAAIGLLVSSAVFALIVTLLGRRMFDAMLPWALAGGIWTAALAAAALIAYLHLVSTFPYPTGAVLLALAGAIAVKLLRPQFRQLARHARFTLSSGGKA